MTQKRCKWEYKAVESDEIKEHLNELGREGWELITIERIANLKFYWFKRLIEE